MCDAFSALGHDVTVYAGVAGHASRAPPWRVRALAPRRGAMPRRGHGDGPASDREPLGPTWSASAVATDAARLAWWPAWTGYFYRRAVPLLESERPDMIYERYVVGSLAGRRLARKLNVPLIVEMNASFTFPTEWWGHHSVIYPWAVRRHEGALGAHASHIVVVSSALRQHLRALGVADTKISVLFNGVDVDRFRPDPDAGAQVRARHGLEPDHQVVGFIGSLRPWHGVELLLSGARRLLSAAPRLRLLIVGDGPVRGTLEASAKEKGLGDRVVFTGSVAREEAPAHVAAMDITVAPYPRLPDFHFSPLKLFEYMAVGKPVVASRYPDISTVIEHGRNGMLVEPGNVDELSNAILELIGDRGLATRLGSAARRHVAGAHTWRRNAEVVLEQALN
jgi:glycosyltransferase involved in cell wall biosynthesis